MPMSFPPIPIEPPADPASNLIEFKAVKREPSLQAKRRQYGDCRHDRVTVDETNRSVTCRDCGVLCDAFTVLLEMAHKERRWLDDLEAWEARRDSMLSERYDEEWSRHQHDITEPPSDPEARKAWDVFRAYFGDKFCGMYKRKQRKRNGQLWYGRSTAGCCVSIGYAQRALVERIGIVKKETKPTNDSA